MNSRDHRNGPATNPQLTEMADQLVELLHARGVLRSCPDCDHWDPGNEQCLKYMVRPPAVVIAKGCDEFEPNIPF